MRHSFPEQHRGWTIAKEIVCDKFDRARAVTGEDYTKSALWLSPGSLSLLVEILVDMWTSMHSLTKVHMWDLTLAVLEIPDGTFIPAGLGARQGNLPHIVSVLQPIDCVYYDQHCFMVATIDWQN
jgi:hypothetical protein